MLWRSVVVVEKCCEGVLWRSVVVKCCSEALWGSVVGQRWEGKRCGEVL